MKGILAGLAKKVNRAIIAYTVVCLVTIAIIILPQVLRYHKGEIALDQKSLKTMVMGYLRENSIRKDSTAFLLGVIILDRRLGRIEKELRRIRESLESGNGKDIEDIVK